MLKNLIIFAGPNGSGKTTLYNSTKNINKYENYLNADDLEKRIKKYGFFELDYLFEINDFLKFYINHNLYEKLNDINNINFKIINKWFFANKKLFNSYHASILIDYIRHLYLKLNLNLTFETVFSAKEKIDFLKLAKLNNYCITIYFITTKDPKINISRIKQRVKNGGHNVEDNKVIKRYYKVMNNLKEILKYSDNFYFYDNSINDKNPTLFLLNQLPKIYEGYLKND